MAVTEQKSVGDEAARWTKLVGRIRRGDKNALSELYDSSSAQVFGLIVRIVSDRAAAEEIALDVYVQVWKRATAFDSDRGSAAAWLFLIARSRAIDYLRSRTGQARGREQALPEEYRQISDQSPDPEAAAEAGSRRAVIVAAMDELDTEKRQAVELAFFGGLSHSEIAEQLRLPIGTVKTRIRSGLQKLRQALKPLGDAL